VYVKPINIYQNGFYLIVPPRLHYSFDSRVVVF